jgi:phenylalanyl-tRNA synthetase beta subunit
VVGAFGPLHPDLDDHFQLEGSALVIELDLRTIRGLGAHRNAYAPLPTLPASTRDVALIAGDEVHAGALADALKSAAGELCRRGSARWRSV